MIERLHIDNYRCLANFEIRFGELALLLGGNGSGKTSVLNVVHAIRRLLSGEIRIDHKGDHPHNDAFPTRTLTRWQSRPRQTIRMEVRLADERYEYTLEVEHERNERRARIFSERLLAGGRPLFSCVKGEVALFRDDHSPGGGYTVDRSESALARVAPRKDNLRLTRFLDFARKIVVCGLHPPSFAAESSSEDAVLLRDGSNFAAWYRHAALEYPELANRLSDDLRNVIEGFRSLRMEKVGMDTRALVATFREGEETYELRLDELSDGQRALIALYAMLHLTAGQGVALFLDEPENYVALAEIQPWLSSLVDVCGADLGQAVLCSHHPELIDHLGPAKGLMLRREASGATTARPPEFPEAEPTLPLSELVARGWER